MFQRAITTLPLLLGALVQHASAAPGACSGSCNIHDPSVIQRESDGVYFRFSTGGEMAIASSTALEGPWTDVGTVLPGGSSSGATDMWVCTNDSIFCAYPHYHEEPWS
jgi:arabinan endo-1,5-alpha-L-arabinosidase